MLLFSKILESGKVSEEWCMGIICPIYKQKGSEQDPGNYRGITLLSSLGKLFTSCINTILTYYVEYNNLMTETQTGFRSTYCTTDHIFILHTLIDLYKQTQTYLLCICGLRQGVRYDK